MHFFPLATVYTKVGSPFWYKITFSPDAAGKTSIWCDVYSTWYQNAFQFEGSVKDSLEQEIKAKIRSYEQRHSASVTGCTAFRVASRSGPARGLHNETYMLGSAYQETIEKMLKEHQKAERAGGEVIQPAAVQQCRSSAFAAAESRKC